VLNLKDKYKNQWEKGDKNRKKRAKLLIGTWGFFFKTLGGETVKEKLKKRPTYSTKKG